MRDFLSETLKLPKVISLFDEQDKITQAQTEAIARGIDIPQISQSFSQNDLLQHIATKMNMNTLQLTQFLWDKYHPSSIWIVVTGIGLVAATSLMIYDKFIMNKK